MGPSSAPSVAPSDHARQLLAPLVLDPRRSVLLTDFDGTLAPIVDEPSAAVPLAGTTELLVGLADVFGRVAVVSGRPVSFLVDRLPGLVGSAVEVVGLYGLETAGPDGEALPDPVVAPWRPVVQAAAERLAERCPAGVLVEEKGATVTVHWRAAQQEQSWVTEAVAAEASRTGLAVHPARLSLELRPPLVIDKGTVVFRRCTGMAGACYLGDDLGDLPAFDALARWATEEDGVAIRVAVDGDDSAPDVVAAADLVVGGPEAVLGLLDWLVSAAG